MPLTYSKLKCYSDFNKSWITPGIENQSIVRTLFIEPIFNIDPSHH